MLGQITPLILTYDESPNVARCLERLVWAKRVVIVDSLSTDETVSLAAGFRNVSMHQREFDNHAAQWNFGLDLVDTDWVLSLDADYMLTDEFVQTLRQLQPSADVDGFYAGFRYWIGGKPLRASLYPPRLVLFRRERGRYVQEGHTQVLRLPGRTESLTGRIDHDDRKSLTRWVWAQDRYARLEAEALLSRDARALPLQDRIRRLIILAPPATLFHTLFIRGVVLDGWRGWFYAFQRTCAEILLSLRLLEARIGRH